MSKRVLVPALVLALLCLPVAASSAATTLRLDGVGPLTLGMSRTAAVATGWLSNRSTGCKLGGAPYPIVYSFRGAKAPAGLVGGAEFDGRTQKLVDMGFSKGVKTAAGVTVGRSSATTMRDLYRGQGFAATAVFDTTFQGTFVSVKKAGRTVLGAFQTKGKSAIGTIAIPSVPVCE